jgi:hypothetical protein
MNDELDKYLSEIASQLNVDPGEEREILQEIRAHLEDAVSELQERGVSRQDSFALATDDFGDSRDVGRMLARLHNDPDWMKVALAIVPGLFAICASSGLFKEVFGASIGHALHENGLMALCVLLIGAGLILERRLAVWTFPALGILLISVWRWIPPPLLDHTSPFWQGASPVLIFAVLAAIGALSVYHVCRQHRTRIRRLGWVLLGLVILVAMAGVVTSAIADRSLNRWMALLATLPPVLLWMGIVLSPIAISLPLARRHGSLAGLIVVAAEFVLVDGFFDPSYALGIWTSDPTIVALVSVVPAIFFLVVAPLLVFPSRSTRGRIGGLLLPVFIALVGGEIISGAVRPYYLDSWTWLMRAIGSVQFLMVVALAAVMCHRIGRRGRLTNIRGGALTDDAATVTGDNALRTV